jgi:RNA polymerase sigma-70 factor (ECF subfamily)
LNTQEAVKQFYEVIWPYRSGVLRTAQILVGSVNEAEDLAQETMVKAFRAIDRFQPGTDVKAWLMTILRNTRIDRLRASTRGKTMSLDQLAMEPAQEMSQEHQADFHWETPQEILEGFADRQIIQALQCLPEEVRWTLLLVDVEGMDQQGAATALGVPIGTIKSRAHRGRRMLREALWAMAKDRRLVRE